LMNTHSGVSPDGRAPAPVRCAAPRCAAPPPDPQHPPSPVMRMVAPSACQMACHLTCVLKARAPAVVSQLIHMVLWMDSSSAAQQQQQQQEPSFPQHNKPQEAAASHLCEPSRSAVDTKGKNKSIAMPLLMQAVQVINASTRQYARLTCSSLITLAFRVRIADKTAEEELGGKAGCCCP
jgi:hypothetical protein